MIIDAGNLTFKELNEIIRNTDKDVVIRNLLGQRYIGAGLNSKKIVIESGIAGNALGAYLDGATILVQGNAQDAVGDTMNNGEIIIDGNAGDTCGYAMRGGKIYIKGSAGYRSGIHMKAYMDHQPVMIVGGTAGSFLGEYQAGGIIVVLGLDSKDARPIIGDFPCTGMHGGKLFVRSNGSGLNFHSRVNVKKCDKEDLEEIREYLAEFASNFDYDLDEILNHEFVVVTPDSKNPYKQMYVAN